MWDILSFFGITGFGVLGLVAAAFIVPQILPKIIVTFVIAVVEAGATIVTRLLQIIFNGLQHIVQSNYAVMTLAIFTLIGGVIGDRYDPFRSQLPTWLQSTPPRQVTSQTTSSRTQTASRTTRTTYRPRAATKSEEPETFTSALEDWFKNFFRGKLF